MRRQPVVPIRDVVEPDDGAEGMGGRGRTPGKGRPTPKRREAQSPRRGPVPPPPRTQRESAKLARENRRRAHSAARLQGGQGRALPPRHRGPVKAWARDVVDSRRHLTGLILPLAGLEFLNGVAPIPRANSPVNLVVMIMFVLMLAEGLVRGRQINRGAREAFPSESINGVSLGFYAFTRSIHPRRLRVPRPRARPGDRSSKDS